MPYKNKADRYKRNREYAKEKLKRVPLDIQHEDYDKYKAHADSRGESMNGFIKRSMRETMQRDLDSDPPKDTPSDGDTDQP